MKKYISVLILAVMILCISGCGQNKADEEVAKTIVSGEFTVCVRDVIPDYCFDEVTPCVAIVTEFQCYPFTIYVGQEMGSQLETGRQYVFSIEPFETDYSAEELQRMNLASIARDLSEFRITGYRLANDDEIGLESKQLQFEPKK